MFNVKIYLILIINFITILYNKYIYITLIMKFPVSRKNTLHFLNTKL